jgi:hypothetical protein
MILRDLAHSIRKQDWFSVAIEFVIVVAGIFVGLQVTDWNEGRQLRERELNYLERMTEDLSQMRTEFDAIRAHSVGRSAVAMRAFQALEQCNDTLATPEDFQIVLGAYQIQPTPAIITRTYDEMVSSGALAAMADRQLSGEIASLFGALAEHKAFVQGVRISLPVVDGILWKSLNLSYDDRGSPVLREFDFATACRNRELRNAVWEIQDLTQDWELATTQAADRLTDFAERLELHVAARTAASAP